MADVKSNRRGKGSAGLLALVLILLAVAGAWVVYQHRHTNKQETAQQPAQVLTQKSESDIIKERAAYIYEYLSSPGDMKYADLETKGYITANVIAAQNNIPEHSHDYLTCSQMPAPKYEYSAASKGEVVGNTATQSITGTYPSSTVFISASWVKEGGIWKLDKVDCSTGM